MSSPSSLCSTGAARFRRRCTLLFLAFSCCNFAFRWYRYRLHGAGVRRRRYDDDEKLRVLGTASSNIDTNTSKTSKRNRKLLYIVTSISEFDTGKRGTTEGYDRFSHTLVPAVRESIKSFFRQSPNDNDRDDAVSFEGVDLYLVAHYEVSQRRYRQLRDALPKEVGLQVWDDATPLGYALEHSQQTIMPITRALARQHRYVIKDKFLEYDFFCNFEDDMVVKAEHVRHYLKLTQQLFDMRQAAPSKFNYAVDKILLPEQASKRYFGTMTSPQLRRCIPGFIRVEVVASDAFRPKQTKKLTKTVPSEYYWNASLSKAKIDPSVCCHVSLDSNNRKTNDTTTIRVPESPSERDLFFWETTVETLGVRQLPNGDWVVLLAGNNDEYYADPSYVVGDYWTGRDTDYFETRPDPTLGRYANNQGGWMGTRRQVIEWHAGLCRGGFLPPYDAPTYKFDGLDARPVEYWSGGLQLSGVLACNLQRLANLDPDGFSAQLLYHSSNNKQTQKNLRYRFSSHSIQEFWGQLNSVKRRAETKMKQYANNSNSNHKSNQS